MFFCENLEEIIFQRHNIVPSDELVIISGYLGPAPIRRLEELPLDVTVVYGMYGDRGVQYRLHRSLLELHNAIENINILYSSVPIHSKCYAWKNNNNIKHALIGSANFSTSGLTIPFREVLAETTHDSFYGLNDYIETVLSNAMACDDSSISVMEQAVVAGPYNQNICTMTLLDPQTNEVQNASGLNWGQSLVAHVDPNDASIPIRVIHVRRYPELFPPKQTMPLVNSGGRSNRHNDEIDIIWDDGHTMKGLLEGSQPIDGIMYPKQIASAPHKRSLGEYIRNRINVPSGARVTKRHLDSYGRTDIDVSLQEQGVYYFDFSVTR